MSSKLIAESLKAQLERLNNVNLTSEEYDAELKRCQAVNVTAGNLIKLGIVSIKAANVALRMQDQGCYKPTGLIAGFIE